MRFLKNHWFGFILSILVIIYMVVFILVLVAPKQDAEKRGFVKCTYQMVENAQLCGGKANFCMLKAIIKNSFCNVETVSDGFIFWVKGEQKTPWANYFFDTPIDADDISAKQLEEFYAENPNLVKNMEILRQKNIKLENEVKENEPKE